MTKLTEQLQKYKNNFNETVSSEILEIISRSVSLLQKQKVLAGSLKLGDVVENNNVNDDKGKPIALDDLLLESPLIITFVRGAWCPYCMLELQAWNHFIQSINSPINFVAVSGETPNLLRLARKDNRLDFSIMVDKDYSLAHKFGLIYEVDSEMKKLLLKWGIDLTKRACTDDFLLPVPATYILDKNHVVRYAFLEEDYTQRAEPQDVYNEYQKLV
jgi:peroxiredoxin